MMRCWYIESKGTYPGMIRLISGQQVIDFFSRDKNGMFGESDILVEVELVMKLSLTEQPLV